jgi:DNA polymerase-3 subunit alpha/error-prone DNA polymerase
MIPLLVRSYYSLMWGTADIDALCRHAAGLGYDRLALTDTDNLYGLWPFIAACEREGIRPVIGAEITDKKISRRAVCLVKDMTGYRNLCRLLTRRHTDVAFDLSVAVIDFSKGLVMLSSDAELLCAWRAAEVDVVAAMPRHPVSAAHALRRAAQKLDIPLVAVPGSFFLKPEDIAVHRVLRAIDKNTALSRLAPGDTAPAAAFLAGPDEYRCRFAVCPEAITNTLAIADRLIFTRPDFGRVMPPYQSDDPAEAAAHLRRAAYDGARRRYGGLPEAVVSRLEHELDIITKMNFSGYFLIVADIVSQSPRTCGRGSGAASLVAYCLGITNVCPIRYNLYFERFLNPGRSDPPDIDVDFAWDERDQVIANVLEKYRGRSAMVANHVRFQARMAIRETAAVFGLTDGEIGRVTRRLPWMWRAEGFDEAFPEAVAGLPQMRGVDFQAPWPEILSIARRLVDAPRHLSVHPGGVVITPDAIDAYVPVQQAPKGVPVIQWDKDGAEDAGLVKIDLLGNRSLGVIRDAVAAVRRNGIEFDERQWVPEDDASTRRSLAAGRTMGCFYIESPAMRLLQQKTGRGGFEDLVIHSSIIRPAANDVIQEYIRRLRGGAWAPIHPLIENVLSETFGLMVFQEDVSRVAVAVAGFSHAEADGLRKVMSRKDRHRHLKDYLERFAAGARKNGLDDARIADIWKMIMSFNGYSFCKPHSASYARVSFQAAYLKTHFPAEFMAAVISNQGGFYSTFAYVSEARRLGITVLPPDVTESEVHWVGCGRTMRVGLLPVRGLSMHMAGHSGGPSIGNTARRCFETRNPWTAGLVDLPTAQRIIAEREKSPFVSSADFFDRVRPDETEAAALIQCGALDRFHPQKHRAALLWEFSCWQRVRDRQPRDGRPRDRNLFPAAPPPNPPPAPDLPEEDLRERLRREFKVLGFLCDRHPMTLFAHRLRDRGMMKACDLENHVGRRIRTAGWLITGKTVLTQKGDPMKFVTFEDETGIMETVFFPKTYHRFCHSLAPGRPYLLSGNVEENWGAATLTVDMVRPLSP